jgi:signal transduction histidine kinase/FixJ family two-component response regulator/HPt (histidine-containing phosphotransfer) domain-containing protein
MFWDYLENTLQLALTISMLLVCLFQYINSHKRGWSYLVIFFLGTLVSSYHWTAYLLIMGESPTSSDAMIYIGWNVAFAVLLMLIWHIKTPEERRYFHPLMLLPIPINIYQLTLYLPYGAVNSIYQVTVLTAVACFSIQGILWQRKHREEGKARILPSVAALLFVCFEFGMWTASCLDEPINQLYYLFSILASLDYLFIVWSVRRVYGTERRNAAATGRRAENILKAVYFTMVVLLCAFGGIMVGSWMRDTITAGLQGNPGVSAYDVIPVILFIFSLVIVVFAMATVIVVYFSHRDRRQEQAESGETGAVFPEHPEGTAETGAGKYTESTPVFGAGTGRRRNNLIIPLLLILCLMILMVLYTSRVINEVTISNLHEVGEDRISSVEAELVNYLDSNKSVVRVTADTVDHMVRKGRSSEEILNYIQEETKILAEQFNEDYTGLYGYIQGRYLDGLAWVPPEGYDPVQRMWYTSAVEAGGEIIIVPPYVDAQTGDIVISICRQLTDRNDVLSLDMTMNSIQDMTKGLQIRGQGYGFIIDGDGLIVAHPDESRKGQKLDETEEQKQFMDRVRETQDGYFEMEIEGKTSTVFVKPVMDQWYVIIAISNDELFAEHWKQLTVNVLICSLIFALIALFYYLGNKNEQNFSRRMEEMKMEEQKQAYETRVLKLEKEAADQANKAKSDFLAEMSHEIRTPINAVLGMNEMILRECDRTGEETSAEAQEEAFRNISDYAANIENAGNSLLSIINDILDFSKIEAGRMEITEGNYELSSLLNDVSNMVSFRAREKGLEYRLTVDQAIPDALYGDKVRVRQIITNLLSNAVKYTDRGTIQMQVRSIEKTYSAGDPVTLEITVRDTGIGIRDEDREKLFTQFQRVDLERNSSVEGTGLGLAITQRLLTMMGGAISVESAYGKGSAFTITLPQKVVSCEPLGEIRIEGARNGEETVRNRESFRAPDARILVVDDSRMNIEVTVGLLKKTGLQTDTAQACTDALKLMETTAYDVIIMDQRMPGMDGTELLHRLHEMKNGPNEKTPVICMTADAIIGARERYIAEGFTDYLPKPVSGDTLQKTLLKYLPPEKVTMVKHVEPETQVSPEATEETERYAPLREAGITPGTGLGYCQQDKALYETLLEEYARSARAKTESMQAYYDTRDWKQYGILVHALKSTSRMIGAETLAKGAEALEKAAKEGNGDYITEHHDGVMKQYRVTAEAAGTVNSAPESPGPEEEILEFPPAE